MKLSGFHFWIFILKNELGFPGEFGEVWVGGIVVVLNYDLAVHCHS
ncbi:hypothetical protein [Microbulbifer variabilis]|nr:hypothetical protein [Microbulbifer variabilis]